MLNLIIPNAQVGFDENTAGLWGKPAVTFVGQDGILSHFAQAEFDENPPGLLEKVKGPRDQRPPAFDLNPP
jgi:hypothetical protein